MCLSYDLNKYIEKIFLLLYVYGIKGLVKFVFCILMYVYMNLWFVDFILKMYVIGYNIDVDVNLLINNSN